jgi:predicted ArsR family transcriptional regulator
MPGDAAEALSGAGRLRAAALARPAAARIADVLAAAPGGMTAQEVATALGLHHTGVRSRLAGLERAGVVEARTDPPDGRGRPARRYVLTPDPAEREAAGHRALVRLLMAVVRESGFGAADVERFGERQGRVFVLPAGGPAEVTAAFERLGFAPREVEPGPAPDLVLDRCPFADGVEAPGGHLICVLHRGLARGMAREAAPGVEVVGLDARDPRLAGCRLRMAVVRDDGGTGVRAGAARDRGA